MKRRLRITSIEHIFQLGRREPSFHALQLVDAVGALVFINTDHPLPTGWEVGELVWVDGDGRLIGVPKPRLTLSGRPIDGENLEA